MAPSSPFRSRLLRLALLVVGVASLAACDTGSRGDGFDIDEDLRPAVEFVDLSPDEGKGGDIVTLTGFGFHMDPARNFVTFRQTGGDADLDGQVLTVAEVGVDEIGRRQTTMTVRVPTNVRSSSVALSVPFDGDLIFAGTKSFFAEPVVTSIVYGATNAGYGTVNVANNTMGDVNVILYGYNLGTVIGAVVNDENSQPVPVMASSIIPVGAPAVPFGMSAANVLISAGTTIVFPNCAESGALEVQLQTAGNSGAVLLSNKVIVKFRKVDAAGFQEDLHASVPSLLVPSGVRAGRIECHFTVHAEAEGSASRFDVTPQYRDETGTFVPCTLVGGSLRVLSGGSSQQSAIASLPAVGHPARFVWDSGADLPGFDGVTQLRILVEQSDNTFLCPGRSDGEIYSGPIAIGNREIQAGALAAGSVLESFDDVWRQDSLNTDDGVWEPLAGELVGVGTPAAAATFGTGLVDVELLPGVAYTIDTDAGIILVDDITLGLPTPLTDAENPGALQQELHVRTLTIHEGALVTVVGSAPVVFRASGTGNPTDTVVQLDGVLDLSGGDGEDGTDDVAGAGGRGVAGGGHGGAGAHAEAGPTSIQEVVTASAGGGAGGGSPGVSTSWVSGSVSIGRGGPGGGGGHDAPGSAGINADVSNNVALAQPGLGGAAYGDSRLFFLSAGSGGGGGGTGIRYVPLSAVFSNKSGGGGGAGGGAIEINADGVVEVNGTINCDGGAGGMGAGGPYSAPGGSGSGGAIVIRANHGLRVSSTAWLSARGRPGTEHNGNSTTYVGGASSDGRIRLESNGAFDFPGFNSFAGLLPTITDSAVGTGINALPIEVGQGTDGVLQLGAEAPGATWVIDTGATPSDFARVFDASGQLVLTAGSPGGVLELATLVLPAGVTLRGWGNNPLTIRVANSATIDGTIDVSGGPGGLVDSVSLVPMAGAGGLPGPGGGHGGVGGVADGSGDVAAGSGGFPLGLPADLVWTPPLSAHDGAGQPIPDPRAHAATGGGNVVGGGNSDFAPGGGGGGYGAAGDDGSTRLGGSSPAVGRGGSAFLNNRFVHPTAFTPLAVGGAGGGGGGASSFAEPPVLHSPGTGGGGGGGYLQISVGGFFSVGPTARLLANGGNAFRAPQFGGNGGGGAGGAIRLQGAGVLQIDGAILSALGGVPDLSVNEHPDPAQVANAIYLENSGAIGGRGGSGRIQIETPHGVSVTPPAVCGDLAVTGICPRPRAGAYLLAHAGFSVARTENYPLSVAAGARPGSAVFQGFAQSPSALANDGPTAWPYVRGLRESLDVPGTMTAFTPWSDDPSTLRDAEQVQLRFVMIGVAQPGGVVVDQPRLAEVELLYEY